MKQELRNSLPLLSSLLLLAFGIFLILYVIPLVDEFETFNCITTPCDMPKITIYEYIDREYINPSVLVFQIPDCNVVATSFCN